MPRFTELILGSLLFEDEGFEHLIYDNLCEKKPPGIGIYTRTQAYHKQDHQGLRRQMCKVCLRSQAKCEIISHLVIFLRFLFRY